jgi:hypothetical protein
MKKSIGLTANTSEFRPSLPQTKHLNYFMGTNPVYMANGGDVRAGISNYPDVNVTRGFLPAALGFDNGGEADSNVVDEVYGFIFNYFKSIFGSDEEAKKETDKVIQDPEKVEEIIKTYSPPSQEVFEREEAIKGLETPRRDTVAPTETVTTTPSDRQPGIGIANTMPPAELPTEIIPEVNNESVIDNGGITTITPDAQPPSGAVDVIGKSTKKWDFNNDGKVDYKDLFIAIKSGSKEAIDAIKAIIGGAIEGWEGEPEPPPISEEQRKRDEEDRQRGIEKIIPKEPEGIIPEPDEPIISDGGITAIDSTGSGRGSDLGGYLETSRRKYDILGKKEQKLIKELASHTDGESIKTKKDVPAWALPMMSAGFAMMASKSPYFLQALGEGGQKGLETFTGMEAAKTEKEKSEAQIKKDLAYDDWYSGGGAGGKPTIITDSAGRRVYAIFNKKTQQYEPILTASGEPQYAVRSRPEIEKSLSTIHMNWANMSADEREKLIQAEINKDLGIAITNVQSSTGTEDKGPGFLESILGGAKEGWKESKDGGIVSLRR